MKRGRKLTVAECNYLRQYRLNPFNWLLSKKRTDRWTIIHRETGRIREIPAP